jgi:hypothetical protein
MGGILPNGACTDAKSPHSLTGTGNVPKGQSARLASSHIARFLERDRCADSRTAAAKWTPV